MQEHQHGRLQNTCSISSQRVGVNSDSSLDYNPNALLERTELQQDVQWWKEWISKLMEELK